MCSRQRKSTCTPCVFANKIFFFSISKHNFFLQTVDYLLCNYQFVFVHRVPFCMVTPQLTIFRYSCFDRLIETSVACFILISVPLYRLKYFKLNPQAIVQNIIRKICLRLGSNSFVGFRTNVILKRRQQWSCVFCRDTRAVLCSTVSDLSNACPFRFRFFGFPFAVLAVEN